MSMVLSDSTMLIYATHPEYASLRQWLLDTLPKVSIISRVEILGYGQFDGVRSGISATFHSGGWTGPTSAYLKRKREKFRRWLAAGFEIEMSQWIEAEIEYLDRNIEREEIDEERSRFD